MTAAESHTIDEPVVSVIVVADYASDSERGWEELRRTLEGLASQDIGLPFETLLCENADVATTLPADLDRLLPGLRIVRAATNSSNGLKNAAAASARAPLLAILDADVVPARDWLRHLVAAMNRHPDVTVASGRTFHRATGLLPRSFALVERGYVDRGHAGPTPYLASHACIHRRDWYLAYPCDVEAGPFSSQLQSAAIQRAGGQLYFEPSARTYHLYDGLVAQADVARNAGYGTIATRIRDRRLPFAWLTRLDVLSLPFFIGGKTLDCLAHCLRLYSYYGIRWYEFPALLAVAVASRCLEARGMWAAFRGRSLDGTAFR